jgi:hypothetical protein
MLPGVPGSMFYAVKFIALGKNFVFGSACVARPLAAAKNVFRG